MPARECVVRLKHPHPAQLRFLRSTARRRALKCGRRSGKTTGLAILAVEQFLQGERVLYHSPTADQLLRFWSEVTAALGEPVRAGIFRKNETLHLLELPGTEHCIRAKTAWEPDHLRGDYGSVLILDEYGMFSERCWPEVIAPMTLDRDALVTFAFTPPSLRSVATSRATDPQHAVKLFKAAQADTTGRWAAFHFSSHANPFLSQTALAEITQDMSHLAYRQEILALESDEVAGALWSRVLLDRTRVRALDVPEMVRLAVALDPAATSTETADEMGIVAGGRGADGHGYVLRDATMRGTPAACAKHALMVYDRLEADVMVAEINGGGEWIGSVIQFVAQEMYRQGERATPRVQYKTVHASRGKQTRAQPIATEYEHGRIHHVGVFPELEDQQCTWIPGMPSPDRMDALVWVMTDLLLGPRQQPNATMALRF